MKATTNLVWLSLLWSVVVASSTGGAVIRKPKSEGNNNNQRRGIERNVAETRTSDEKGKIEALQLINTITDTKIVDLKDGLVIVVDDIEGMTRPSFNILAIAADDGYGVESVVFGYGNDEDYTRIEYEPYAFCGNDGNNFNKCPRLTYGNHTVTATPYSEVSAEGKAGTTFSVSFSIVQSIPDDTKPTKSPATPPITSPKPAPVPVSRPMPIPVPTPVRPPTPTIQVGEISALELINSNTDRKIMNLANGTIVDVSEINGLSRPAFNIKATVTGVVRSVKYLYNRFTFQSLENGPGPYAFCGNNGTNYKRCRRLVYGSHTVTAIPYTRLDGRGQMGSPFTVSFSVVPGSSGPPTNGTTDDDVTPPVLIDLIALNATSVDVTDGESAVAMTVVVKDNGSGFKGGYIAAFDDQQDQFLSSDKFILEDPVTGKTLSFNTSLVLQQTTPSGNYTLELYLVDSIGNEIDISSDDLKNRSYPYYIEVINDSFDLTPPKLLEFVAMSPTRVNVTSDDTSIEFKIVVQDDGSGFDYGNIEATLVGDNFGFISARFDSFSSISDEPLEFNVTLEIPEFIDAGVYALDIYLYDDDGNVNTIDSNELESLNYTSTIEILNAMSDGEPPEFLDLALNSTTVNVTNEPATIEVRINVAENISGVSLCTVEAFPTESNDVFTSFYGSTSFVEPIVGDNLSINVTLFIPQYSASGNYTLFIAIFDFAGNSISISSAELSQMKLPSSIQVVNDITDESAPTIVDLVALTPTTVNVSAGPATLELQFVVQDDFTGVRYADVLFSGTSFSSSFGFPVNNEIGGDPYVFNRTFPFDQTTPPGNYEISISLSDGARNDMMYEADDLDDLGLPSTIRIINTNTDFDPPTLINFIALSPTTVDVSNGSATVELQVTVQDDDKGFLNGTIELYDYEELFVNVSYATFASDTPSSGIPLTFNITLTIPPYIREDTYSLTVSLYDTVLNFNSFSDFSLEDSNFVSEITVINANEDTMPPELLDIVALSPSTLDVSSGPATFDIQIVAQDDKSGVREAYMYILSSDEDIVFDQYTLYVPISGEEAKVNLTLSFRQNFPGGEYPFYIVIQDGAFNYLEYDSEELIDLGYVGSVTIEN